MVRKNDLKVNVCCVCKFPCKLRRVEGISNDPKEKWYEIRCGGFGHTIIAHHKGKKQVVDIWNTINREEK